MKKIAVVHRGKVIIIIKYYRLSHDVVTSISILAKKKMYLFLVFIQY